MTGDFREVLARDDIDAVSITTQDHWHALIAVAAARAGTEETKGMIATTGKARSLGERSIGYPDPGAMSTTFILEAMERFVRARG